MSSKIPRYILPIIVIAQFSCTSLWFASNAVIGELVSAFHLGDGAVGNLTSAVQFGFITGTLVFAFLTITDRFPPSVVFLICAVLGAASNSGLLLSSNNNLTLIAFRFLTGFFLAGIYPVGMKIAADYFEKGLGIALGFLVGALVLGTSFPHFLKGVELGFSYQTIIIITSTLALTGGILIWVMVPSGPFRRASQHLDLTAFFRVFRHTTFRSAAFGYFGHMWELYTFWAFVPVMLTLYSQQQFVAISTSLWSFLIIAGGSLACILGGFLSIRFGSKRIASLALAASGVCCLLVPLVFSLPKIPFLLFLIFWGLVVIADSPLFSTLVAQSAETHIKGTALTIVNCIGFAITIISIQLMTWLYLRFEQPWIFLILAFGPTFGLINLWCKQRHVAPTS